ncbi:unnamed protein product [Larinioides sclopetarius]|uniref:Uncharacterized protein n=1 Tax=Larinioides sclopetarius TaxID=280406 RepID=A0AAV1ZEJ5_9ARAC
MEIVEEFTDPLAIKQNVNNDNDDKEFCSFYYKAIKRLLDIDNRANVSYLHRYFKIFNEYYDFWCQVKLDLKDHDRTIINLLHDTLYYRLVYVYRNATILSSAIAFHFRNIYKQSPMNIKRLMKKKIVKVCSLGGCSASDIVAIVTVLESIASKNGMELDFRVTIIESDERWKITYITILSCLKQFHKATWKITFIHGNLTKKNAWTPETCNAIEEADIITMIRFLSKFKHNKKITQMICDELQPQALLFILDNPLTEIIEFSFRITDSDSFELIHKELCDLHTLDIEVVKYFNQLYQKQFGDLRQYRTNTSFNVFISVSMKASPESAIKRQNNLERIFLSNVEKYNPKQSVLSFNAFTRWENLFTKEKEAAGWSAKGIRKIVQEEKERRNSLLVEFIDQKKKLDALQKNLLNSFNLLKKEEVAIVCENDEGSLDSYLTQKRQYSLIKKTIYYSSFRSLYAYA